MSESLHALFPLGTVQVPLAKFFSDQNGVTLKKKYTYVHMYIYKDVRVLAYVCVLMPRKGLASRRAQGQKRSIEYLFTY